MSVVGRGRAGPTCGAGRLVGVVRTGFRHCHFDRHLIVEIAGLDSGTFVARGGTGQ